jgi:WD40 repeat protein
LIYDSDFELIHTLEHHKKWITSISFSKDGKYCASGGGEGFVLIYEVNNNFKLYAKLQSHQVI